MAVNFNIQFRVTGTSRVIRLTDTSTGFTYGKGCFYIGFPDGSTRILPDFTNPDLTVAGTFIDIAAVTDISNNVITGTYTITYAVTNNVAAEQTPLSRTFDFNWTEPVNGLTNLSDVVIPEVVFNDATSYSPIGSFTGVLTRTLSCSFPSTSEAAAQSAVTSTTSSTITVVSAVNYYEGLYTPNSVVSVAYTHSSNAWLTILFTKTFTKTFDVRKCPNQLELVVKINVYRAIIDAYKGKNDTQFNILSEQYDLVVALYSHLIARYSTSTQDGSEPILRELLSILEPYSGTYTYQSTKIFLFEISASTTNSFNISDGTNTDAVGMSSTLTFASGNASLIPIVTNNNVTYSPTFGAVANTFAQGSDSRFHGPVTIGTANGLSIATQAISLAAATTGTAGSMSAADKTKLDGIATGATSNAGTVTSVAISVPSAFGITGSPIVAAGTIAISAVGVSTQYITGAGALATLNTANTPELTNLYHTSVRVRAAISLTTSGVAGASTYDNTTGVLNIPAYVGGVTSFNTRTGAIVLSSADVTTALSYTPYNVTNPAGYITGITGGNVTTALGYTPENLANKGIANGYAGLDSSGFVPSTQLPSYVDDVLEYADLISLPATGIAGKIYVTLDTNKIYRWGGTVYVEVSPSVGSLWGGISGTLANQTDLQAALDAKANLASPTFTGTVSGITKAMVGLSSVDNTSDVAKPISTATQTALDLKYNVSNPSGYTSNVGTVTSVILTAPAAFTVTGSPVTTAGTLAIAAAGTSSQYITGAGALATLNTANVPEFTNLYYTDARVRAAISLTVTGASGASTYTGATGVLNIPTYTLSGLGGQSLATNLTSLSALAFVSTSFVKMSAAGTFALDTSVYLTSITSGNVTTALGFTPYNATNPNGYTSNVGTVTSVAALTLGTTGTDLSSSVATGTVTPVITLQVPNASASNRGALLAADWSTFNSKQATVSLTTTGTSGAATFSANTLNIPNYGSALSGYLPLTGGTLTGSLVGTAATFSGSVSNRLTLNSTSADGGYMSLQKNGADKAYIQWNYNAATNAAGNHLLLTNIVAGGSVYMQTVGGNNAIFGSDLSTTLGGALTGTSATFSGAIGITKSQTDNSSLLTLSNPSTSGAFAASTISLQTYNGTSVNDVLILSTTSNNWTYQAYGANASTVYASGTGGLNLMAGNASGIIKFFTAGDALVNQRMTITSAGNVLIGTTTDSGYKFDVNGTSRHSGHTTFGAPIRLKGYTVSTLPAGTQGDAAFVTDALAPTFMSILVGGGSVVSRCFYNGTNWTSQ